MPIAKLELTRYEKVVKKIVDEALEPYERRFSIQKTDLADTGWEIEVTPKSQKAARVWIGNIVSDRISVSVDDIYNLECVADEDEYNQDLPEFKAHFQAVLRGDAIGYHIKNKRDPLRGYLKTVIEFKIKGEIIPWQSNVFFRKRFIKRKDVVVQDFEHY